MGSEVGVLKQVVHGGRQLFVGGVHPFDHSTHMPEVRASRLVELVRVMLTSQLECSIEIHEPCHCRLARFNGDVRASISWQIEAVKDALGSETVRVHPAVCFTDAEWGWFTKPFELRDVLITGPVTLAHRISEPGDLDQVEVLRIAFDLSRALPAK